MKYLSTYILILFGSIALSAQNHADCDSALLICNKNTLVLPINDRAGIMFWIWTMPTALMKSYLAHDAVIVLDSLADGQSGTFNTIVAHLMPFR